MTPTGNLLDGFKRSWKEQATSNVRGLAYVAAGWIVLKLHLPPDIVLPLTFGICQLWSAGEKAIIRTHDAGETALQPHVGFEITPRFYPPIEDRWPSPPTPKGLPRVSNTAAHLDALAPRLLGFFNGLGEAVKANLPASFGADLAQLANDFAAEGKGVLATELATAEAKWPPEAQAIAAVGVQVADSEIDKANAAAQAEVAKWTAIKAAAQANGG